jgi:hypothetical protein
VTNLNEGGEEVGKIPVAKTLVRPLANPILSFLLQPALTPRQFPQRLRLRAAFEVEVQFCFGQAGDKGGLR